MLIQWKAIPPVTSLGKLPQDISVSFRMIGLIQVGCCHLSSISNPNICLSVPMDVEHTVIWTKVPIYHPDLVHESIKARIDQDGIWGFTGNNSPPPSPSNLPACLPSLSEWGTTMHMLVRSTPPTLEEAALVEKASSEVQRYVRNRWSETEWETAWFVNPPVSHPG